VYAIPSLNRQSKGRSIANLLQMLPDEKLAQEILPAYCSASGEAMVVGHQDDERLPVDHVVLEVVARLHAQEGQVKLAAGERFGEIGRIVAGDGDVDVLQFVVQHVHRLRQPIHLLPGLEADSERVPRWLRCPARRVDRGIDLHQR